MSNSETRPSIYYESQSSVFDLLIGELPNLCVYSNPKHLHTVSFDAYWTNNPTQHTSHIDSVKQLHIPDMIYFREMPANSIKKEDKFLIQNKFANSNQIYRNDLIKQHWSMDSDMALEYGVPAIPLSESKPTKSMVFINTRKQKSLYILYKQIQQYWPSIEILDDIDGYSIGELGSKLQEYQLCIAAEDDYNIAFSVASGCRVLSNRNMDSCDYIMFDNLENMLDSIAKELDNYQHYNRIEAAKQVVKHYDIDIFSTRIHRYIMQTIRKPVLI
jgi:hypothetical protein